METVQTRSLPSESISESAAHELAPTPVVTRSGDVSRAATTSTVVLRSQVRGGRSSAAISEVQSESRPDMESGQDVENPA